MQVAPGAAVVLHSQRTFQPPVDGLALLAYCKRGSGYASLYERRGGQVRALQMARPVSATATVPIDGDVLYTELYLLPVRAGAEYGVYITATGEDTPVEFCEWGLYLSPFAATDSRP